MAVIGLAAVTIVAMVLWTFLSVVSSFRPVTYGRFGLAVMYGLAALWAVGVV